MDSAILWGKKEAGRKEGKMERQSTHASRGRVIILLPRQERIWQVFKFLYVVHISSFFLL